MAKLLPSLLPILPVNNQVLLPASTLYLQITDPSGCQLVEKYLWDEQNWVTKYIGIVPREHQKELHSVGVAASVTKMTFRTHPQPCFSLLVTGLCRFRIDKIRQKVPYIIASITQLDYLDENEDLSAEVEDLAQEFRSKASELVDILQQYTPRAIKIKNLLDTLPDYTLPDFFTSIVKATTDEKLEILDATNLTERFKLAQPLLIRQIETLRHFDNSHSTIKDKGVVLSGRRRRMIEPSSDDDEDDLKELQRKIQNADLPEHAMKAAQKELKRLVALPTHFPEHSVSRTYLEVLLDLPWSKRTSDTLDIKKARLDLNHDHYGLEKVKKRILEYLAVAQLKNSLKGPILCLVGAPGVGKTSVGRSIANTMGRKFHRISVGGVSDQSDIRGHRRTYIGSIPGRIIQGLRNVGVCNPVILLDEVDKLSKGIHGDPAAALLEVLDSEQNHTFTDHYLGIPFDLSQVLFIATANSTSTIPSPLLDRMEVIRLPGYTIEEKGEIASRHLVPKLLEQHGLANDQLILPIDIIKTIATYYTREAGVRELERQISAICRAIAIKRAEGDKKAITISPDILHDILGPRKYEKDIAERLTQPGVAIGLAWTPSGGQIMFVEATQMVGTGKLVLTGQLGSVMKESAQIALNWLRANSAHYQLNCGDINNTDIHIHFPAGAVEKDGPSAGVTIATVLASMYSKVCVCSDVAMTGELTLRGHVLPVGGIKEKILAAHRAGIKNIILPKKNEKDLTEIPSQTKDSLNLILVQTIDEVLEAAFNNKLKEKLKSKL